MRQGNWGGRGVGGGRWLRSTAYDSSHVCASPQSISHERLMTNDFFLEMSPNRHHCLFSVPPAPETITSATCWCCGTGRGIDAAGYCTVALFVFPFLEIMSEEAEEEMVDASQSSAASLALPCHTIPVSKYLTAIEALCSIEAVQGTRSSCGALACCHAFVRFQMAVHTTLYMLY